MEAVQAKTLRWAKTRRGCATLVAGALAGLKAIADSSLAGIPLALLLYVAIATGLVYVAAWFWESKTQPKTPGFARSRSSSIQGRQLREDGNARLWSDHGGFLFEKRFFFTATGLPP